MSEFINLTNHPSVNWSEKQREAAEAYGPVSDLPFPAINPAWTDLELNRTVTYYFELIRSLMNPVVLVQGDFLFTFRLVCMLKKANIKALTACCERRACEKVLADRSIEKTSVFVFSSFREY